MAVTKDYVEDGTVYRICESMAALVDETDQPGACRDHNWSTFSPSFIGRRDIRTWAEAKAAAQGLWGEGNEIVEGMLEALKHAEMPRPATRKRRRRYSDEAGDEVDYDRLRLGQPFWRTSRRAHTHGSQFVTLIVDVGASCGTDAKKILWRGAAAVVLTHLLEQAGYRVEVWVVVKSRDIYQKGPKDLLLAACVKEPEQALDREAVTIAISGWFFRTVIFRGMVVEARRTRRNLGVPTVPSATDLDQITSDRDGNRHVIADFWTREKALETVKRVINTLEAGRTPATVSV